MTTETNASSTEVYAVPTEINASSTEVYATPTETNAPSTEVYATTTETNAPSTEAYATSTEVYATSTDSGLKNRIAICSIILSSFWNLYVFISFFIYNHDIPLGFGQQQDAKYAGKGTIERYLSLKFQNTIL